MTKPTPEKIEIDCCLQIVGSVKQVSKIISVIKQIHTYE